MKQNAINTLVNQTIEEIGEIETDVRSLDNIMTSPSVEVIFYGESGNSFARYYKGSVGRHFESFEFREHLPYYYDMINFLNKEDLKSYYNTLFEVLKPKLNSLSGLDIGELPMEILSDNGFYTRIG